MTIEFCWRQFFEILIIQKPSLGPHDVPHKIWAWSVQLFWRHFWKQTDRRQIDRQAKYVCRWCIHLSHFLPSIILKKKTHLILLKLSLMSFVDFVYFFIRWKMSNFRNQFEIYSYDLLRKSILLNITNIVKIADFKNVSFYHQIN